MLLQPTMVFPAERHKLGSLGVGRHHSLQATSLSALVPLLFATPLLTRLLPLATPLVTPVPIVVAFVTPHVIPFVPLTLLYRPAEVLLCIFFGDEQEGGGHPEGTPLLLPLPLPLLPFPLLPTLPIGPLGYHPPLVRPRVCVPIRQHTDIANRPPIDPSSQGTYQVSSTPAVLPLLAKRGPWGAGFALGLGGGGFGSLLGWGAGSPLHSPCRKIFFPLFLGAP